MLARVRVVPAQRTGGLSNACTAHAQHVGQELMRDVELIGVRPISSHQEPTSKPRLHEMEAGASGRLYQLAQHYVEVTVQRSLQRRAVFELTAKCRRLHSPGRARALHQGASGAALTPSINEIPSMPSSPTSPTSRRARPSIGVIRETKLSVGNKTWRICCPGRRSTSPKRSLTCWQRASRR